MKIGVFGATGYAGREIVRLLGTHPQAEVAFTTGSSAGHVPHEEGLGREADAYLLALPHGISATYAGKLREAYPKAVVVDLSGDLRLPTPARCNVQGCSVLGIFRQPARVRSASARTSG